MKVFNRAKYFKNMKMSQEEIDNYRKKHILAWFDECEGKEVINGVCCDYIISDEWCSNKEKTMKKKIKDLTEEEMENQGFMLMLHQMGKGDENGITPCKVIHFGKSVNDFLNTEVDIPQPHILDKEEHDYLRAVCKPYDVYKIVKIDCLSCYKITIFYNTPNDTYLTFSLPIFDEESPMYKGMKPDKHYTIEDLELDKEWNNEN